MEYFLLHGYTWVPPHWRPPLFLTLALITLRLGWKTDQVRALYRRLGFFSLASALYFCMMSPAIVLAEGHGPEFDPAKGMAIAFVIVSILLFLFAAKRKEPRTALDFGWVRLGGDETSERDVE